MNGQRKPMQQPSFITQLKRGLYFASTMLIAIIISSILLGSVAFSIQQANYNEANAIQTNLNTLLNSMIYQETGLLGYINTGNRVFLEPFDSGRPAYLAADANLEQELQNSNFLSTRLQLGQVEKNVDLWYTNFALVQLHLVQERQFYTVRLDDINLYGKHLFDNFRLSVTQLQQAETSDIERQQTLLNIFYGGLLLTAVLVALIIAGLLRVIFGRLTRDLSFQLEALNQTARKLGEGLLSARVPSLRHHELEHVGETMNAMAGALRQRQIELQLALAETEAAQNESVALFQASNEAIIFVSANQQHLTVNRRFSEFFGISAEDVAGNSFRDSHVSWSNLRARWMTCFADAAAFQAFLDQSLQDQTQVLKQLIHQAVPQVRELECVSSPVYDVAQTLLGRHYVLRDVTQEREVDRMKSEFISLVSREFRTPLTSISGFIELILEEMAGELNEVQLEFLNIVQKNTARLSSLVDELLDVSRIEAGQVQLTLRPVDLGQIIRNVVNSFQPLIEEKKQHLTVQLLPSFPPLLADENRVSQILSNLVSNAYQYSPPGGTIEIATRRERDAIRIDVRDTGVGMTPQEQANLFTQFFRAQNSMTEQVGGSGSGLLISRSLIEMHGGSIQVSSAPGQGSTFSFTLPLGMGQTQEPSSPTDAAPVEAAPAEAAPAKAPDEKKDRVLSASESSKKRVLVVDDAPEITALLQFYLEHHGYEVVVAYTGQQALDQVSNHAIDFITLDIMLPDINGLTVLEQLKSREETARIPVLLLSAIDREGQFPNYSNVQFMMKPFKRDAVIRVIESALAAADKDKQVVTVTDTNRS